MSPRTSASAPRRPERTRIKDVAAAAGVSITTVSDALSGKGRLPQHTRDRVREVAADLGYRPSALARSLRRGRSHLIGLVVTKYGETAWTFTRLPFFSAIVDSAVTAAIERGYALVVLPAGSHQPPWDEVPFDGVYVVDPRSDDPTVATMRERGIPVVTDRANARRGDSWVDTDHGTAVRTVCEHLVDRGARSVGVLAAEGTDTYTRQCLTVYERWCAEHAVRPRVERAGPDDEHVLQAARRLLDGPGAPDAAFGLEDVHGPQLLAAAAQCGRTVPDQLLLACFSEDPANATYDTPLTTISVRPAEIATASVAALVDAIDRSPPRTVGHLVGCQLYPRASTAGLP